MTAARRHLVWDWNGTLLDDLDLVVRATNVAFASAGGPAVTADEPLPPLPPDPSEGSHFSYTVQWFTFSLMTVVVYVLILRRRAREIEREEREAELDRADPDDEPEAGDPRISAEAPDGGQSSG